MKCPACKGGELDFWNECPRCNGTGKVENMTNDEWRKTCSTEEFAEFLLDVWSGIEDVINIMAEDGEISKRDAMLKWLKEEHCD